MRDVERRKTLTELEGEDWGKPGCDSPLMLECYELRKKPLDTLSIENLRVLIGQQIGLEYLIPVALDFLLENPLVQGDFYPGDLLNNVLMVNYLFWENNLDLKDKLDLIIQQALPVPPELEEALSSYFEAFPFAK
jgi:hypothetical protein